MPYQTRKPSIKITLDRELFNKIVSILNSNASFNIEDENLSKTAEKLKEKILKYSVPRLNEEQIEFAETRFFPSEASDIIWQLLLVSIKSKDDNNDYFMELIKNHEELKNNN